MKLSLSLITVLFLGLFFCSAQRSAKKISQPLDSINLNGLKWRNIGPALTSGRISDIAVNPKNPYQYYIASSAGGVWKTDNAGNTYQAIFDSQGSYSIGCITIDPNNQNIIWVGTGENNNQRSVSYGDGVYKSLDGGKSWKNVGLGTSEHIGKILVDPENSDIVYVAAIGPLWSKGGERGVYKTIDGGATWEAVLTIDEHTGVTDLIMDPRDTNVLYAASYQRRRHVYTYVGGGPGSGLHKTVDGGATWTKVENGLPKVELGRIGLEISPANPEIIYAIVEAADGKGGFYKSKNRGASWEKQGDHSTSGNYYQEIIADPLEENTIYSMDTWMSVSKDGGKSFNKVGEDYKHVDNHSMWIDPNNNKHWLVGCDGGIYETFDAANNWDFKENLPITQFYKVAVDNAKPFYNVYGGTQDNFSLGGPSRVLTNHGITNADWFITHGGDGFESQVDPFDPNIVYAQSQYGFLVRFDRKSGEEVGIQPRESVSENAFRFNWDAPLAVSRHKKGRLYFASNKVFRSDDYGNSWQTISDDLTAQIDRNSLKVYDRVVSIDAVSKNGSTSLYGTIVALSESPLDEDLLAIGTDDGLIQISTDGGVNWKKAAAMPNAPIQSYINSVFLSKHDKNTIYAAVNHHKYGDFKPYIYKSMNLGSTWTKISSNLPDRGSVYAIEEDHVNKNLIFCGTEFGAFFSPNQGGRWKKLANGLPTIAVRDIAIQERESDLVLGTFGRGFYVLDDYSSLRSITNSDITETAKIYAIRDALVWEQQMPLGLPGKAFQGDNFYSAENLGPEAIITYYYNKDFKSIKDQRTKLEVAFIKENQSVAYPVLDSLRKEREEIEPKLLFTIKDANGEIVKKELKTPKKGLQRFKWNLRYEVLNPINFNKPTFYNPFAGKKEGTLVLPGNYTIEMELLHNDQLTMLVEPTSFVVTALDNSSIPIDNREAKVAFQRDMARLQSKAAISNELISDMDNKLKYIKEAIRVSNISFDAVIADIRKIENNLNTIKLQFYGDPIKDKLDIDQPISPARRLGIISFEQKYSTSSPTKTHMDSYKIADGQISSIKTKLENLYNEDFKALEKLLIDAGAPYTPGRGLKN